MAAQTWVILDSSSPPPAFRHPSVTPQKSDDASSSSPCLPEVSTFFRPDLNTLTRASRTAGVLPGFTSAGTLHKAAALEAERKDEDGKNKATEKKSAGKLVRAVKQLPQGEVAMVRDQETTRTGSISLSDFDFRPDEDAMLPPRTVKKAGKRTLGLKDGAGRIKVGETANTAEDGSTAVPKTKKRAGKKNPATFVTDVEGNIAKKPIRNGSPEQEVSSERPRKHSISISNFSYGSRDATPAIETDHQSAYFSPKVHGLAPDAAASEARSTVANVVEAHSRSARQGSISLSKLDYRPDSNFQTAGPSESKQEITKNARKQTADPKAKRTAKKPKKRLAKSESIILNSDEPDPLSGDASREFVDRGTPVEQIEAAIPTSNAGKYPKKARTAARSNLTESEIPTEPGFGVWSQSVYLNADSVRHSIEVNVSAKSLQNVFAANEETHNAVCHELDLSEHLQSPQARASFPRRRSWTPAKNTYAVLDPEVDSPGKSPVPRKSLADLVNGFGYDEKAYPRIRTPIGEPMTKKRRIEAARDSAVLSAQRKTAAVEEKVKKVKAPKKKPQTITDLATRAYRPEEVGAPNVQSTVSEFFSAQKDDHIRAAGTVSTEAGEQPPISEKPRKPRARKVGGEASTAKRLSKPKSVKVKFDDCPALLSPHRARAEERKQDLLFGTSSQLVLEEDVGYVRDLQTAIQESEAVETESLSPKRTRVSVGQATRRLFWSASRDTWGHVIAANGIPRRKGADPRTATLQKPQPQIATELIAHTQSVPAHDAIAHQDPLEGEIDVLGQSEVSQVVDLRGTSPVSDTEDFEPGLDSYEQSVKAMSSMTVPEATVSVATAPGADDSWMLLGSDGVGADELVEGLLTAPPDIISVNEPPVAKLPTPETFAAATSPARSRSHLRTALKALDSNIPMLVQTFPAKQRRDFASQNSPDGGDKRTPGPPKLVTLTSGATLSPKRRGRPPKSASPAKHDPHDLHDLPPFSASQPPLSSEFVAIDDIPDSASDDLSLRDVIAARALTPSSKRKGRSTKASQLSPKTSPSKSSFVNLEDISDSDVEKQTPPPRRRTAAAISPVRTLELSPSAVTSSDLPSIADGKAAVKPTDICWLPISQVLFPQISAVVRSTPPCGEADRVLSWWEKILMYDPIVLEDLTDWLVGRGVHILVRRKTVKAKKTGRKKKAEAEDDVVEEDGFEVVKEELKGWMVQKWCEENGICCLWREGLRGGVRVRY